MGRAAALTGPVRFTETGRGAGGRARDRAPKVLVATRRRTSSSPAKGSGSGVLLSWPRPSTTTSSRSPRSCGALDPLRLHGRPGPPSHSPRPPGARLSPPPAHPRRSGPAGWPSATTPVRSRRLPGRGRHPRRKIREMVGLARGPDPPVVIAGPQSIGPRFSLAPQISSGGRANAAQGGGQAPSTLIIPRDDSPTSSPSRTAV